MEPSGHPQRQRIGQRRAGPGADPVEERPALARLDQIAQGRANSRGHIRARRGAIGYLVVERRRDNPRSAGVDVDERVLFRHRASPLLIVAVAKGLRPFAASHKEKPSRNLPFAPAHRKGGALWQKR